MDLLRHAPSILSRDPPRHVAPARLILEIDIGQDAIVALRTSKLSLCSTRLQGRAK
jgi:hypothetical protein